MMYLTFTFSCSDLYFYLRIKFIRVQKDVSTSKTESGYDTTHTSNVSCYYYC